MPSLPILSRTNLESESAWHAYYQNVYGESADGFDLNELTWFYNYAPYSPTHVSTTSTPKINEAYRWTDTDLHVSNFFNVMNPERVLHSIGFFVNKAIRVPRAGDRVEILRVSDLEFGCAWFYLVKGSGIFITLPDTARTLHHSRSFGESTTFPSDTEIHNYMVSNELDVMTVESSARLAPIEMIMLQPWYRTAIPNKNMANKRVLAHVRCFKRAMAAANTINTTAK